MPQFNTYLQGGVLWAKPEPHGKVLALDYITRAKGEEVESIALNRCWLPPDEDLPLLSGSLNKVALGQVLPGRLGQTRSATSVVNRNRGRLSGLLNFFDIHVAPTKPLPNFTVQ